MMKKFERYPSRVYFQKQNFWLLEYMHLLSYQILPDCINFLLPEMRVPFILQPQQYSVLSDLNFAQLFGVKWYLMALICISLTASVVKCLFVSFLPIQISFRGGVSFVYLFRDYIFVQILRHSLNILDIDLLAVIYITNIYIQSVVYILTLVLLMSRSFNFPEVTFINIQGPAQITPFYYKIFYYKIISM